MTRIVKTDIELVKLAQVGDQKAMNELMERYKVVSASVVRRYFLVGGDMDDLMQEGMMGVVNAINSFNENKGEFKSYVYSCVKNRIITCIKTYNAIKNKPLKDYVSLSGGLDDGDKTLIIQDPKLGPEDLFIENESEKELNEKIKDLLSDTEYKILSLYVEGLSYGQISAKTNKNVKAVDNAIQRIRKKLRKYYRTKWLWNI